MQVQNAVWTEDLSRYDLHFRTANEPCVVFHADGRIEFGEKYRNNPDAAAQEFMRIVCETWPQFSKSAA